MCKHCLISIVSEAEGAACPGCGRLADDETPRTAFIADEDRPFRTFLVDELRRLGFEVEVFSCGEGLLERIRGERPALLLANVYLSGMLGVEICEKIKEDVSLPTKVLLIGAIFRADRYKARPTSHYGADGYCEEGLSADAFRVIVGKTMRGGPEATDAAVEGGRR